MKNSADNSRKKNAPTILSILAMVAFFWWILAGANTAPIAFYTFAVLYGGFYVDWARRNPVMPLKQAKHRVNFDILIVIVMMVGVFSGGSSVLAIAGGVIFVIGTVGADIFLYYRARKDSKTDK
ncbi:hypothetical protein [Lacticaseibacillus hulanensis]|uniref:hypothetical protein n=1 Tax=Lacticaseibacillus hulanensis TaxID=2493111 RepID=UPI000FD9098C|nr:hypothetical protein [Lacticaseibacillus hulanensis]